eukprot:GHVT01067333.1.p2 GENE.GHVT01067333.1~~GHVT01067333.1.p2  ORF type:complete len:112 (-),score=15.85 GHVT01067333.1:572-907(-)
MLDRRERPERGETKVLQMIMSVGFNPHFENSTLTAEAHIFNLQAARTELVGRPLDLLLVAFVRPEGKFLSLERLVQAIELDCRTALSYLANCPAVVREGLQWRPGTRQHTH